MRCGAVFAGVGRADFAYLDGFIAFGDSRRLGSGAAVGGSCHCRGNEEAVGLVDERMKEMPGLTRNFLLQASVVEGFSLKSLCPCISTASNKKFQVGSKNFGMARSSTTRISLAILVLG